jgi:sterol 3beta-glucosyltransferase
MRIMIIAMGSRGDVQPYIALARGLKAAGHSVRFATNEDFEWLVNSYGLEFYPLQGNVQAFLEEPENRKLLENGRFIALNIRAAKVFQRVAIAWAEGGLVAAQGMDLLIAGVGGLFLALSLAEKLNIPLLQAYIFPFTPTKVFPAVVFPLSIAKFGGIFNRLSHHVLRQIMWQSSRQGDELARRQVLILPTAPFFGNYNSVHLQRYPVLYGLSPSVIAKPSDWRNTQITGYWFLEETDNWSPPHALLAFLESGSPPVFIGFGSMASRDPQETADLALRAIALTGQRAILQSGWSGLSQQDLPDTVLMVDSIPHTWLFPRVTAVVHHGGAGTTAAGLRAGIPNIVIPFFADQPFWGHLVAQLGVGTAPISRKELTAEKLAKAIQQAVNDPVMRQRATDLGAKIRSENGVANVVAIIEELEQRGDFLDNNI